MSLTTPLVLPPGDDSGLAEKRIGSRTSNLERFGESCGSHQKKIAFTLRYRFALGFTAFQFYDSCVCELKTSLTCATDANCGRKRRTLIFHRFNSPLKINFSFAARHTWREVSCDLFWGVFEAGQLHANPIRRESFPSTYHIVRVSKQQFRPEIAREWMNFPFLTEGRSKSILFSGNSHPRQRNSVK